MIVWEIFSGTTEPVSIGAIVGLLSGVITLLAAILRYLHKGWTAIDTVLHKIDDTAEKLEKLEEEVKYIREQGSDPMQDIRKKLEGGQVRTVPNPARRF